MCSISTNGERDTMTQQVYVEVNLVNFLVDRLSWLLVSGIVT